MRPEDITLFSGFKTSENVGFPELRHFHYSEFDSPDETGSGIKMDMEFLKTIDYIRDACGFPFKINSGYRSPAHNEALKAAGQEAVDDSAHTKGKACDIAIADSSQRMTLVKTALKYGIYRIGIGSTFIHLDSDMDKPRMVMWLYSRNRG